LYLKLFLLYKGILYNLFYLNILLNKFSIKFVSFILGIASLFYLVYLCEGIIETSNIRKNSLAYVVVPSLCVAFFIVTYILPKILF